MDGNGILLLGLGIQSHWKLMNQRLDVDKQPHELHLTVSTESGAASTPVRCAARRVRHMTSSTRSGGI